MSSLKIGVVVDGTDQFFRPIHKELCKYYLVDYFHPRFVRLPLIGTRVNEYLLDIELQHFVGQHDVTFFEWAGTLLERVSRLPKRGRVVTRLHSFELAEFASQVAWSRIDSVIVLSDAIHRRLRTVAREPLPPVATIANGVDLAQYTLQPQPFNRRLGMVCNLSPIKRIYEMILCLYQLRQEGHPFTLHIAGEAMDRERRYAWALEDLVTSLHQADHVCFYGYVEGIAGWLRDIDVFISNSFWEGQQVALLEAMASGCYCLSHCWDGVDEVLPPENIFTTDAELRAKILAYADLPEAEKRQAQAGMRAIAEDKFDERRMVSQIVDIIEQVATG